MNTIPPVPNEPLTMLRQMLGPDAQFRDGQLEAIAALVVDRARLLVVEQTGWGKSIVYFIATRLLRDQGAGPTFLVSPLLSLMRNQQEMAKRLGLNAIRIDSSNREDWAEVYSMLQNNEADLLMVSPERLANPDFRRQQLPAIQRGVGMVVIDEAHCISDWGHDFRPDYRRIVQIVRALPSTPPVLATTATANDRVVADVQAQLGDRPQVMRGVLTRQSLRLQTVVMPSQAERLAWLANELPKLSGTGIVYCLTVRDVELVSRWLQNRGVAAFAYYGDLGNELRIEREQMLINNECKALVATVALGMGFDKPDLGFVVHFQRPGNVIAYYQQIGRAGRAGSDAFCVLLSGAEDDEIQHYFIDQAFPPAERLVEVASVLADSEGLSVRELEARINLPHRKMEQCLKFLEVEGAVAREGTRYFRTPVAWQPDTGRAAAVTAQRLHEMAEMQRFLRTDACLMQFVAGQLDDFAAEPCGRCANCAGDFVSREVDPEISAAASLFLGRAWQSISPRIQLPTGVLPDRPRKIEPEVRNETGLALCAYSDNGWGDLVRSGKYQRGCFDDRLVAAAAEAIAATWPVDRAWWIAAVPSLRHPQLVQGFAERLAATLEIAFHPALVKKRETGEQKTMQNSAMQCTNVLTAFRADPAQVKDGPVILVDDIVDSRWTFTVAGAVLRRAGSGEVYPFALAAQRGSID